MAANELILLVRSSKRLGDLLLSKDIDARIATWDERQKEAVKHLMDVLGQMTLQIARELREGKQQSDDRVRSLIACTTAFHQSIMHKAYPG